MKKITLLFCFIFLLSNLQTVDAQLLEKIVKKTEKKIERKIEKKADKEIDDILNGTKKERETKKQEREAKKKKKNNKTTENIPKTEKKDTESSITQLPPEIWRNYKFIPGEKVIFYDDLKFEEVGEFPSRWDLKQGGAEIISINNEKAILGTAKYYNKITPLFDSENYLTDEFTVEFDIYLSDFSEKVNIWSNYNIVFNIDKRKKGKVITFKLRKGGIYGQAFSGDFKIEKVPLGTPNSWHHIAISYYKGKLKMYYDEKRILNLPRIDVKPENVTIDYSSHDTKKTGVTAAIKNIRIAHGGGQMYKRIIADGKYTTNGILFDSGKATIQAQSMGIINKMVTVMKESPEWNFQIIGHTDSDGATESNLTLSLQRAEAVKEAIITQGVEAKRLSVLGKGENEPLNNNATPEEKANNRRVEFVKQ